MTPYFIDEGSIQLPEGFHDRSTHIFVLGEPDTSTLNFNISRDKVRPGEDLPQYVTRQIGMMKSKLPGYTLQTRQAAQLGSNPAIEGEQIEAMQKQKGQPFYQRQAAFMIDDSRVLVFSATSGRKLDNAFETCWQQWLGSFVLRPPAATPDKE